MGSAYDSETGIWRSARQLDGMEVEELLLGDRAVAAAPPERTALIDAVSGARVSFGELRCRVEWAAAGLAALHLLPPANSAATALLLLPNSTRYMELFAAAAASGAAVAPLNPAYTPPEIRRQAADCRPSLLVTTPSLLTNAAAAGLRLPVVLLGEESDAACAEGSAEYLTESSGVFAETEHSGKADDRRVVSYGEVLAAGRAALEAGQWRRRLVRPAEEETVALLYSSGTTGASKGVMLTRRNLAAAAAIADAEAAAEGRPRGGGGDVMLVALPLFHVFGLVVAAFATLQRGDTVVIVPRFAGVADLLHAVDRFHVTQLPAVPPIVLAIAKLSPDDRRFHLSSLRNLLSGAAPLHADTMRAVTARFPSVDVRQGYGLTESTGMGLLSIANEDPGYLGSAGSLVTGVEAMVIDVSSGKPLPPNKEGELWMRGPNIMKGYLNNPDATAATVDEAGWLHTGDLAYVNDAGRVYIVDRLKELIKYKGFQVAPAELEGLLLSHSEVLDAAVVPLADEESGEVPIAYVVRRSGSSLEEADVLKFVSSQVAPYKRLRKAIFISTIPKSPAGKILRRELRDRAPSKL